MKTKTITELQPYLMRKEFFSRILKPSHSTNAYRMTFAGFVRVAPPNSKQPQREHGSIF